MADDQVKFCFPPNMVYMDPTKFVSLRGKMELVMPKTYQEKFYIVKGANEKRRFYSNDPVLIAADDNWCRRRDNENVAVFSTRESAEKYITDMGIDGASVLRSVEDAD